jgi:calcineurin-like phosphoesterase family protein
MSNIWLVSDTHFSHENILNFIDSRTGLKVRPGFANVDEMDECMIDNWNSAVKQGDKVYHLGDVMFGSKDRFAKLWPKLNGSKRLIVGNHDDIRYLSSGGFFKEVYLERKFRDEKIHLSHIPLHPSQHEVGSPGSKNFFCNVHGHIHGNPTPVGRYINVSVEVINYTPVAFEDIVAKAKILLKEFVD